MLFRSIRSFLQEDYEIAMIDSSQDDLDDLQSDDFSLILIESSLLGRNWRDLTKKIRVKSNAISLPILILGPKFRESDLEAVVGLGANDYIGKPFEPKDMGAQYYPCPGGNHEDIIHPITKKICKKPAKGWKWISSTLQDRLRYKKSEIVRGKNLIIAGRTKYGLDETTIPRQVYYLEDAIHHALPTMITLPHSLGKSDLPDGISFSTPKPVNLIKNLLKSVKKDDITVLDYFAGSGATAQAVYELNNHEIGRAHV